MLDMESLCAGELGMISCGILVCWGAKYASYGIPVCWGTRYASYGIPLCGEISMLDM
jgi:hypothetical protein